MAQTPPRSLWQTFLYNRRREWVMLKRNSPSQLQFWFIALVLGVLAGYAALGFRIAVEEAQAFFYGAEDVTQSELHWLRVLVLPIVGGLAVGLILWRFTPDGRVRSVAHVIEGLLCTKDGSNDAQDGLLQWPR